MPQEGNGFDKEMQERFNSLPKSVQDAITSAGVEKHLRELADSHKLHLDQWTALENEVMLALLGFEPVSDLAKNIESEVHVDAATAAALASDVSQIVFAPIRGELERILEHPEAQAASTTGMESMRSEILAQEKAAAAPTVAPATPPASPPEATVERAPLSAAYAPSVASHERKAIEGDPYREQII